MYQGGEELGDVNEALKTEPSGFSAGWETAQLSYGGNLEEETYNKIVKTFPDYTENTKDYDAWITSNEWTMGNTNIVRYEKAIDNDEFRLDAGNNIILGANGVQGMQILFDMDAMRGALLARKHGYTRDTFNTQYGELAKEQAGAIAQQREGTSTLGYIGGVIAGHMMQPESLQEIATSPAKIMGSTILKGMGKAFVAEGAVGLVGEVAREQRIREHMEKADLDYTLWDSVQQILLGAGLGGTFRAIGSGVIDAKTAREIGKRVTDPTDKTIVGRFFQREEYKLTQDTNKHLALMAKAKEDMDNGMPVDIADATDIDINTKTNPDIEEISLRDELVKRDIDNGYEVEVKKFEEEFAQADEIKPKDPLAEPIEDEYFKYDGMATREEGDILSEDYLSPEDLAEFKANDAELAQPIKEPTAKEVLPQVTAVTGNIVERAQALQGNKYVWGGTDLKKGADCSGFVQSIHKEQGINLPRTAWGQAKGTQGKNIAFDDMQIGDTIYFKPSQTGKKYAPVTHTGIITGMKNGKFIMTHAKGKKYGTVTEELSPGYIDRFYSAKRFTEDGVPGERVPTEAPTPKEVKERVVIDEDITPQMEKTLLKQEEADLNFFNEAQEVPKIEEVELSPTTIKELEKEIVKLKKEKASEEEINVLLEKIEKRRRPRIKKKTISEMATIEEVKPAIDKKSKEWEELNIEKIKKIKAKMKEETPFDKYKNISREAFKKDFDRVPNKNIQISRNVKYIYIDKKSGNEYIALNEPKYSTANVFLEKIDDKYIADMKKKYKNIKIISNKEAETFKEEIITDIKKERFYSEANKKAIDKLKKAKTENARTKIFEELDKETQKEVLKDLPSKIQSKIVFYTKPETVGALYGFEQDEEGYWTYNVAKGALGAAGVHIAGKALTSKKMKEFVIKHMKEYI